MLVSMPLNLRLQRSHAYSYLTLDTHHTVYRRDFRAFRVTSLCYQSNVVCPVACDILVVYTELKNNDIVFFWGGGDYNMEAGKNL